MRKSIVVGFTDSLLTSTFDTAQENVKDIRYKLSENWLTISIVEKDCWDQHFYIPLSRIRHINAQGFE